MSLLEISLIIDNIKRFGGYREKEVLKDLIKIELIRNDKDYKIYRFENENSSFEYNFITHTITN
jgi:hypothetical protein